MITLESIEKNTEKRYENIAETICGDVGQKIGI